MQQSEASGGDSASGALSGRTVLTSISANGVLEVVLRRPSAHNAISRELSSSLLAAIEEGRSNREVRAIILRGEGPSFSSGQDLSEAPTAADIERLQAICRALRTGPPAIAAVHGHAIGGGAEIAFACDFIVASSDSTFRLPEVELGLAPGGGVSMFLVSALGPNRAARLLLLGEKLSAQTARSAGLVHSVTDDSGLLAAARELADTLARSDPAAVRRAKACLRAAWTELYDAAYSSELKAMLGASRDRWPDRPRR